MVVTLLGTSLQPTLKQPSVVAEHGPLFCIHPVGLASDNEGCCYQKCPAHSPIPTGCGNARFHPPSSCLRIQEPCPEEFPPHGFRQPREEWAATLAPRLLHSSAAHRASRGGGGGGSGSLSTRGHVILQGGAGQHPFPSLTRGGKLVAVHG